MVSRLVSILVVSLALGFAADAPSQSPSTPQQLEFFETEIRPLLASRCHKCHGSGKQKSKLRLDHIDHARKGGERGPALVPGKPGDSRMVRAVEYEDPDLQMPPKRKLPAEEIALLRRWIELGAPWPDEPLPRAKPKDAKNEFDIHKRKAEHWAWQPRRRESPPLIDDPAWRANPIDRFVISKLLERGLRPAPLADRATLLRRVTFDLIGLPPTVAELDAFLADDDADAYRKVVDRLLASPHFGEHWARHWLDLVRFAETMGHEFDYTIPNAWRYRDYVIRAFNDDVPYDQFVREHIAGDLLESPRRHPEQGFDESIIGTGFFWFVEQVHSPVDVRKHTADRTHNQIDVLTKTFVGLTVGCARCHDHKFDAISTADYYALSGFLKSSRYMQRDANPKLEGEALRTLTRTSKELTTAWAARIRYSIDDDMPYFVAAAARRLGRATHDDLDPGLSKLWDDALRDKQIDRDALHPLHGIAQLGKIREGEDDVRAAWLRATKSARNRVAEFAKSGPVSFVDFRKDYFTDWFKEGVAFGRGPVLGQTMVHADWIPTTVHPGGWAHSNAHGPRAQGVLHSRRFTIDKPYLHVLAHGRESRIKVVLEGFHLIRAPIYGTLKQFVNSTTPRWYTVDLRMWKGKRAYIALCDQVANDLGDATRKDGYRKDGYLAVQRAVFADDRNPPRPHAGMAESVFGTEGEPIRSLQDVADAYKAAITRAVDALEKGTTTDEQARLLSWMWEKKLFRGNANIDALRRTVIDASSRIVDDMHVPAMADGTGEDENVFVRGGHDILGPVTPRGFLTAIVGKDQCQTPKKGSGRLELANAIVAPDNPFASRVAVNRLWHHVFGRGLVATVDNFGVQGQPPTHPELLDWLARQLVRDGWSIKKSIRRMVLSRTYRQSSRRDPELDAKDPQNLWLHRARVRRLTGESIRDGILQTSGRLDRKMHGPSVPMHLTKYMTGRGRGRSGPPDGAGRRSIYLGVSRNFLSPFLLAFDFPLPTSTMGRRSVTNVPAQALAMLNDPFVKEQAVRWAKQVTTSNETPRARVRVMYRETFGREVRPEEEHEVFAFLERQARTHGCGLDDPRPWQDLGHALWNVKEFIFIR